MNIDAIFLRKANQLALHAPSYLQCLHHLLPGLLSILSYICSGCCIDVLLQSSHFPPLHSDWVLGMPLKQQQYSHFRNCFIAVKLIGQGLLLDSDPQGWC
jgi:hypothetical protein